MDCNPLCRIGPSPGKGLGALASCDIKVGQWILRDKPLFLVNDAREVPQAVQDVVP